MLETLACLKILDKIFLKVSNSVMSGQVDRRLGLGAAGTLTGYKSLGSVVFNNFFENKTVQFFLAKGFLEREKIYNWPAH